MKTLKALIVVCMALSGYSNARSQVSIPDQKKVDAVETVDRKAFYDLMLYLLRKPDDEGLRLVIEYAKTLGPRGQRDLCLLVNSGCLIPANDARLVFDDLLSSKDDQLIVAALDPLAYDYSDICTADELKVIKKLTDSRSEEVRVYAKRAAYRIEHHLGLTE